MIKHVRYTVGGLLSGKKKPLYNPSLDVAVVDSTSIFVIDCPQTCRTIIPTLSTLTKVAVCRGAKK